MILGDGYLQKTGSKNSRLRLEHKSDHYDYLVWKTQLLPQLFQGKPNVMERVHPITHKIYSYVRIQSNSSPYLGKFRSLFYPNDRKHIPNNLASLLNDNIAFAIWYYDDGYYYKRDRCSYVYLGRVVSEEADIASKAVRDKFKLVNRVLDKKNKGFVLYFSPSENDNIKRIIEKYPVPIMAYKIPS